MKRGSKSLGPKRMRPKQRYDPLPLAPTAANTAIRSFFLPTEVFPTSSFNSIQLPMQEINQPVGFSTPFPRGFSSPTSFHTISTTTASAGSSTSTSSQISTAYSVTTRLSESVQLGVDPVSLAPSADSKPPIPLFNDSPRNQPSDQEPVFPFRFTTSSLAGLQTKIPIENRENEDLNILGLQRVDSEHLKLDRQPKKAEPSRRRQSHMEHVSYENNNTTYRTNNSSTDALVEVDSPLPIVCARPPHLHVRTSSTDSNVSDSQCTQETVVQEDQEESESQDETFLKRATSNASTINNDNREATHINNSGREELEEDTHTQILPAVASSLARSNSELGNHPPISNSNRAPSPNIPPIHPNRPLVRGNSLFSFLPNSLSRTVTNGPLISPVYPHTPSISHSENEDFCTPSNQPVHMRTDEELEEDMANARILNGVPPSPSPSPSPSYLANLTNYTKGSPSGNKPPKKLKSGLDSMSTLSSTLPFQSFANNPFIPPSPVSNPERAIQDKKSILSLSSITFNNHGRFQHDFDYLLTVGSGNFGQVMKCRHRLDGALYAVKRIKKATKTVNAAILNEVYALSYLSSQSPPPSVLSYSGCWIENHQLYIVTQWCEGGSLAEQEKKTNLFNDNSLLLLLLNLAKGLQWLHSHNIAHMDIKQENILLAKNILNNHYYNNTSNCNTTENIPSSIPLFKLADYGLATLLTSSPISLGDKDYLPPTALNEEDHPSINTGNNNNNVAIRVNNSALDMYAIGLLLIELLINKRVPEWNTAMAAAVKSGDFSYLQNLSNVFLQQIIVELLNIDSVTRLTAEDLVIRIETYLNPLYQENLYLKSRVDRLETEKRALDYKVERIKELEKQNEMMLKHIEHIEESIRKR